MKIISSVSFAVAVMITLVFMTIANSEPYSSYDSVESWFKDNQVDLEAIVDTLVAHPKIARVDNEGLESLKDYQNGILDDSDIKEWNNILTSLNELGVMSVNSARMGRDHREKMISAQFVLKSVGTIFRGYVIILEYIPELELVNQIRSEGDSIREIPSERNWYVIEKKY